MVKIHDAKLTSYNEFVALYKKNEWFKVGNWPLPNLTFSIFSCAIMDRENYEYFGVFSNPIAYLSVHGETFDSQKEFDELGAFFEKKINKKDFLFFEELLKKQQELHKKIIQKTNLVKKTKILDKSFEKNIKSMFDDLILLTSTFEFEKAISVVLEKLLANRLSELGRTDVFLPQFLEVDKLSDTANFSNSINELASQLKSGKRKKSSRDYKTKIDVVLDKYGYLGSYLLSAEPYDFSAIEKMIATSMNQEKQKKHKTVRLNIQDEFLKKQVWLLNALSINRLRRVELLAKVFSELIPQLKLIANESGLTLQQIYELHINELFNLIQSRYKKKNSITDYKFTAFHAKGEYLVLSQADAARFRKEYLEKQQAVNEIKGTSAHPGIVKGKVRVIASYNQFSTFLDGEILVCSMTDPNYVPLMKKSIAIITDMGGILCHAAIVSRELKKPCIIATKIATKALKTGMFVELDADTGIIKIIK